MIEWMDHVGIVVDDLAAATEFFVALGLELRDEAAPVEGRWVDRVVGLDAVRMDIAVVQTPDGHGRLELTKFHAPASQDGGGPAARSSWAKWCASRTPSCSATSAARRGSSSS